MGHRVLILFQRRLKRGLCYLCDGGALGHLMVPESFTDRGMPPEGCPLSVDVLSRLILLLRKLPEAIDNKTKGTKLV